MSESSGKRCPSCGQATTGKFCSNCGSAAAVTCGSCGAAVKDGSRFCHKCGTPVAGAGRGASAVGPSNANLVWVAVGLAAIALVLSLVSLARGGGAPPPTAGPIASAPFAAGGGAVPDISNMSPREQADRLFNRIMSAHERGDGGEIAQFREMAIQAYELLGGLDDDARYHVGLIHAVTGDLQSAQAQADTLLASTPNHLLGLMLNNTLAQMTGDQAMVAGTYKAFLDAYGGEVATGKQEYLDHGTALENFRLDAQAGAGG